MNVVVPYTAGGKQGHGLWWGVRLIILLGGLLVVHVPAFAAGDTPETRRTLRDLPGVQVVVEDLDAEVELSGLSRAQLQVDVERWLRMAGLRVFTAAEQKQQPGCPELHVQVMTAKEAQQELYAVALTVEFQQKMVLVHDPTIRIMAATWRAEGVGLVDAKHLCAIHADLQDYVEDFIQDYLAMNPQSPLDSWLPVPRDGHVKETCSDHARDQVERPTIRRR